MTVEIKEPLKAGVRGSPENATRRPILEAAGLRFKTLGYTRTRVAEIAADVGISKAYVYKLFSSKRDLGDAVCRYFLTDILDHIDQRVAEVPSATQKLRRLYETLVADSVESFFKEHKLYEICATSAIERWPSTFEFITGLDKRLDAILILGRERGEFERKTPLPDVRNAIARSTMSLANPMMLQYQLDDAPTAITEVIDLVLRSLAP